MATALIYHHIGFSPAGFFEHPATHFAPLMLIGSQLDHATLPAEPVATARLPLHAHNVLPTPSANQIDEAGCAKRTVGQDNDRHVQQQETF